MCLTLLIHTFHRLMRLIAATKMDIEQYKYLAFIMGTALRADGKMCLKRLRQLEDPTLTPLNTVHCRDYFRKRFTTSTLSTVREGDFDDPDLLNAFEVLCSAVSEGLTDGVLTMARMRRDRLDPKESIYCIMLVKPGNTFAP